MRLIIGLGNPGPLYAGNRHNVGHLVIDRLQRSKISKDFIIRKSDVFMNNSGEFVKRLVDQYRLNLSDLWVIHDDLDIPLGSYKIQKGKGPKNHKGLADIYEKLGSRDFWHVRVGVDNRDSDSRTQGEEYVLQDFTGKEKNILDPVIDGICKKLVTL